ncbi:MAG: hypothetical protein Q7R54_02420 [bacterium]|nr:hypothetical protein [bacterium]
MTKKNNTRRVAIEVGAGLAAVGAAAAAGYYFYGSTKAKQHRKSAVKWAHDMKKDVIQETKRLKKVSPEDFAMIVDRATRAYRDIRGVDKAELKRAAHELKTNWKMVAREARSSKGVKKIVKRVRAKVRSR